MSDTRKVVNVFLASPGDLVNERKAAKSVVDEHNSLWADHFGYQVELVGWEDTVASFGRPQAKINRDLERCELFIGLIWKRWGTPPDTSGIYTSGFEEEFWTSVRSRVAKNRPEISLFFKMVDAELLRDPGDDLKRVLKFRDKIIAEKQIIFQEFSNLPEFEGRIRRCITAYVLNLKAREDTEVSDTGRIRPTSSQSQPEVAASNNPPGANFSIEGASFLRNLAPKLERDIEREPISAAEVARFRLLGSIVGTNGNDEKALGIHDANILFDENAEFVFGSREISGLFTCGLEYYTQENTPLWHWYVAMGGFRRSVLSLFSFFGSSVDRRVGALAAMRVISEPLPPDSKTDRALVLDIWFSDRATNTLKLAALNYLCECGKMGDLPTINQEIERNDTQTRTAAYDAVIRINLRDSREKAILVLYELQPLAISQNLLTALFEKSDALSNALILGGVAHKNAQVRRITTNLLIDRDALTSETAEQLTIDEDAEVRLAAVRTLVAGGRIYSDEEIRKILTKPAIASGFGTLGSMFSTSDSVGEACWERFRRERLQLMNDRELEAALEAITVFDMAAHFIFMERHFKKNGEYLRQAVVDQYESIFAKHLEKFSSYGETFEKTKSLENYIRKGLTRSALDIICRKTDPHDLSLIRRALESGFVDYSDFDVEYLRAFGEWGDIPLIISLLERPSMGYGRNLLSMILNDSKYRIAAQAICAIGQGRLPEILTMQMPPLLLAHVIIAVVEKEFRDLNDVSVNALLRSESDVVRKMTSLKCVKTLTKKRVARILFEYRQDRSLRYYNVIHWLDMGISVPRDRVLPAIERIIKEWRDQ